MPRADHLTVVATPTSRRSQAEEYAPLVEHYTQAILAAEDRRHSSHRALYASTSVCDEDD